MKNLLDFFKAGAIITRGRALRSRDPGQGIEYNRINPTYRVSKKLWKVDMARTPQVGMRGVNIDVHCEAWLANTYESMINYTDNKAKGRRR